VRNKNRKDSSPDTQYSNLTVDSYVFINCLSGKNVFMKAVRCAALGSVQDLNPF